MRSRTANITGSIYNRWRAALGAARWWLAPVLVAVLSAAGGAVEIELGVEFGRPGEESTVAAVLHSEGDAVSGFQNDIVFDPRTAVEAVGGRPACAVNPEIERGGSSFAFVGQGCDGEPCERMRAVVFSLTSLEPIPDGSLLYTCRVRVAAGAIPGAYPLFCPQENVEAADPDGNVLPSSCREGAIVVRDATPAPGETPTYDPDAPRADGLPCASAAQCVSGMCVARVCAGDDFATPTPPPTATIAPPATATPTPSGPLPSPTTTPQPTRPLPTPQPQATNTPRPNDGACAVTPGGGSGAALLWLAPCVALVLRRRGAASRAGRALLLLGLAASLGACSSDDDAPRAAATPTQALSPSATASASAAASFTAPPPETPPPTATTAPSTEAPTATAAPATHTAAPSATVAPPVATPTPSPTIPGDLADALLGGETTVFDATRNAYGQPARNLPLALRTDFFVGNAFFNRNWVTAPSSNSGLDGLGPVFNARSCSSCHPRDGRGRPPLAPDEAMLSMLIRLSVPGAGAHGEPLAEPSYGGQLGPLSILGVAAEGRAVVTYEEVPGAFADGDPYALRRPRYALVDLAFGPPAADYLLSPRVAPAVFGVGLLESVAADDILAGEDPDDADGDGISGRANWVWDRRGAAPALGRFGWKANVPTVEQQAAGAFLGDIGLTSELFPAEDCPPPQSACAAAPTGGSPELDADKVDFVTFYMRHLAVPARRALADPAARRGEELFDEIGCAACHRGALRTAPDGDVALADQLIHPYTDLLLHDMGEELADGRPDFAAGGSEWRTPPLWGVGLLATVNQHTLLLHDGRARDLSEAILWHGGEGAAARELFRALSRDDRAALLRFLESL